MTSTSAPPSFTPNLKGDARLDWKRFDNVIKTEACQILREITGGTGLLGYFLPAVQWNIFPRNIRQDGTIIPVFDIVTPIAQPAGNATNAVVKIWEKAQSDRTLIHNAVQAFTAKLINSLPPADISELGHPTWGILDVTAADIYQHLITKYSVLNAADFATITAKLSEPKSADEDFPALAERHRDLHAVCASAGQPISEYNKCLHYIEAVRTNPAGVFATQLYTQATPLIGDQTFANLVAHVALHAPNYVPTTKTLGFSVAMAAQTAPPPPTTEASLAAQVAKLQRDIATLKGNNAKKSATARTKYCHVHGYGYHTGVTCKTMLADPSLYSATQLSAADPTHPPGGSNKH